MGQEEKHPTNTDGWSGCKNKILLKRYYFAASALAASIIAWLAYM